MEKKQTAVEWLEEKLKENLKHIVINNDYVLMESIFLQAKEMEKEQIIDAANQSNFQDLDGLGICETITKGKQYYNETYGKETDRS